jgi:DNA-binding Lrp family transcriptional regulator
MNENKLVEYVLKYKRANFGVGPSYTDIARELGVSNGCVYKIVERCEKAGILKTIRQDNGRRKHGGIVLTGERWVEPEGLDERVAVEKKKDMRIWVAFDFSDLNGTFYTRTFEWVFQPMTVAAAWEWVEAQGLLNARVFESSSCKEQIVVR